MTLRSRIKQLRDAAGHRERRRRSAGDHRLPFARREAATPRTSDPAEGLPYEFERDADADFLQTLAPRRRRTSARCFAMASATRFWSAAKTAPGQSLRLAYNILQAAGCRIFKTDYVACPSCGRTLFNLQTTTARIKAATEHLKGVKIAIMGCIVNGPGEMADADFGYVGGAPGKINLYVGKTRGEIQHSRSRSGGSLAGSDSRARQMG